MPLLKEKGCAPLYSATVKMQLQGKDPPPFPRVQVSARPLDPVIFETIGFSKPWLYSYSYFVIEKGCDKCGDCSLFSQGHLLATDLLHLQRVH